MFRQVVTKLVFVTLIFMLATKLSIKYTKFSHNKIKLGYVFCKQYLIYVA